MGTPSIKRAYNLGLKAVPNFETLPDDVIVYYEQHLDQIPRALARGFVPAEETKQYPFCSVIATTQLGAVGGKKTSKCFTNPSRYYYRDDDFDNWLPANQSEADACVISTFEFKKDWMFEEAAAKVLGFSAAGTNSKLLGETLIENGHTITLAQAEEMVEKTERGEQTGMRTEGYANFFFVETGNEDEPVSVARVGRDDSRWYADVYRLDIGRRSDAGHRLLVRNLDASKL
ncbi:MAG: hypothetical protein ACYC75_03055 [Minisyncoccota bacterium]